MTTTRKVSEVRHDTPTSHQVVEMGATDSATEYVLQGDYGYGHGWEDLGAYVRRAEAHADLGAYREAEPDARHRIIRRRG